jgi:hypothetical protein
MPISTVTGFRRATRRLPISPFRLLLMAPTKICTKCENPLKPDQVGHCREVHLGLI